MRARIQEFFDLHVKTQYRKAEELVAEDTKDYFYTHDKPTYLSCEITKIDYSENFTKAECGGHLFALHPDARIYRQADEGAGDEHVEAGERQVGLVRGSGCAAEHAVRPDEAGRIFRTTARRRPRLRWPTFRRRPIS